MPMLAVGMIDFPEKHGMTTQVCVMASSVY
jgi:hypothetical protein